MLRWFRHDLRRGSLLALMALAVNLIASFGHLHLAEALAHPSQVVSDHADTHDCDRTDHAHQHAGIPAHDHADDAPPSGEHAHGLCLLCATIAVSLLLPAPATQVARVQTYTSAAHGTEATPSLTSIATHAFLARAPPRA